MHLITWLYICLAIEMVPFFWDILDETVFTGQYIFLVLFTAFFIVNLFTLSWKETYNNNKDILYRFAAFSFKAVSILITLLSVRAKIFFSFLKNFKYKESIDTFLKLIFLKLSIKFVIWRPIFRKWSYFGFFKTNRSKWWKNK